MQIAHSSNIRQNRKWRSYAVFEPCAHRGRTPSCAELLAELGLSRVVIGARDTNAQAAGGAEILRRGGIEVKFDVCHAAATELAEPFYLARESGFCFIKINAALNGAVHGRIGSEKQRAFVHELRGVCDYVGVGGQTVRADRPTLDVRAAKFGEISALVGSADMLALDAHVAPQNLKLHAMCGSARAATLTISPIATSCGKEKCIANMSARSKVKIGTINESEVKAKRAAGYFLEN